MTDRRDTVAPSPQQPTKEAAPWCRDAWFVLTLHGDGQGTSLHRGWEAICEALVAAHYFQPDEDQRAEVMAKFLDWEIWENVGGHPWRWFSDYEDGSITVERVTENAEIDRFTAQRVTAAEAILSAKQSPSSPARRRSSKSLYKPPGPALVSGAR